MKQKVTGWWVILKDVSGTSHTIFLTFSRNNQLYFWLEKIMRLWSGSKRSLINKHIILLVLILDNRNISILFVHKITNKIQQFTTNISVALGTIHWPNYIYLDYGSIYYRNNNKNVSFFSNNKLLNNIGMLLKELNDNSFILFISFHLQFTPKFSRYIIVRNDAELL